MKALPLAASSILLAAGSALAQQSQEYRDGYADGYRDGFDKGYARARAELQQRIETESRNAPLLIQSAFYGAEYGGGNCDATRHVQREANGRRSATINVSNDICGDPAPGKRKSLTVNFVCGSVSKSASAYEHRKVYLSCG
jgi:hypothetical protein